jgi:hypothetical protein
MKKVRSILFRLLRPAASARYPRSKQSRWSRVDQQAQYRHVRLELLRNPVVDSLFRPTRGCVYSMARKARDSHHGSEHRCLFRVVYSVHDARNWHARGGCEHALCLVCFGCQYLLHYPSVQRQPLECARDWKLDWKSPDLGGLNPIYHHPFLRHPPAKLRPPRKSSPICLYAEPFESFPKKL